MLGLLASRSWKKFHEVSPKETACSTLQALLGLRSQPWRQVELSREPQTLGW